MNTITIILDRNKLGIAEKMIKSGDWTLESALVFLEAPITSGYVSVPPEQIVAGPYRYEPFPEDQRAVDFIDNRMEYTSIPHGFMQSGVEHMPKGTVTTSSSGGNGVTTVVAKESVLKNIKKGYDNNY